MRSARAKLTCRTTCSSSYPCACSCSPPSHVHGSEHAHAHEDEHEYVAGKRWSDHSKLFLGLCCAALWCGQAAADPVFTGKIALTGMYYTENDGVTGAANVANETATASTIGYLDVRALLEGKRLWHDKLDLRLDLRLRFTGDLDFGQLFNNSASVEQSYTNNPYQSLGVSARGYLGGPEYELREAYGLLRLTDRYTLQIGRQFVHEADALKIDGVRLLRQFGPSWEGSVFAGAAPNPYSRSVLTDYVAPCGDGVAGAAVTTASGMMVAPPCTTSGPQIGAAGGVSARYNYASIWGMLGLVGEVFAGPGSGGPVEPAPGLSNGTLPSLQAASTALAAPRIYLNWMTSWRPIERLDVFADAVFDFYGSQGPQVTRLVTLATLRLLKDDRLTLRLGYTHLSSLAVDIFLERMLYNRLNGLTLSGMAGAVENNLTVMGTGRDELRGTVDVKIWRRLGAYVDGRLRNRVQMDGDSNQLVYGAAVYTNNVASLGGDVTVALRDGGSVGGIRYGLSFTELWNFIAQNHVLNVDLGRDFFKERLGVDLNYVLAATTDGGATLSASAANSIANCTPQDPFLLGCFGQRTGLTHEVGATIIGNPWRKLFVLVDYRFVALLTNPEQFLMTLYGLSPNIPTVLSHSILLRTEFRW